MKPNITHYRNHHDGNCILLTDAYTLYSPSHRFEASAPITWEWCQDVDYIHIALKILRFLSYIMGCATITSAVVSIL